MGPNLGAYAAAARAEAARIKDAPGPAPKTVDQCSKCSLNESRLTAREAELDKANAQVDDLAARIVDLEAKLHVVPDEERVTQMVTLADTVRRLQSSDVVQRKTIAFAEARVLQLLGLLWAHGIETPAEPDLPGWNRS